MIILMIIALQGIVEFKIFREAMQLDVDRDMFIDRESHNGQVITLYYRLLKNHLTGELLDAPITYNYLNIDESNVFKLLPPNFQENIKDMLLDLNIGRPKNDTKQLKSNIKKIGHYDK